MRVLVVILKATSALDSSMPLISALAKRGDDVSVFYVAYNRKRIVRKGKYYVNTLRSLGVSQYDLSDCLPWYLRHLARSIMSISPWDITWNSRHVIMRYKRKIQQYEQRLQFRADVHRKLDALCPDLVLLDHRSSLGFPGWSQAYDWLLQEQRPTVLLPHAPHHTGSNVVTKFPDGYSVLSEHIDHWMPFIHDRPSGGDEGSGVKYFQSGYAGMDSKWIETFTSGADAPVRRRKTVLLIIRQFLPEGEDIPKGHDGFIFRYAEMFTLMQGIRAALASLSMEVGVIVKPHPSNHYPQTIAFFDNMGMPILDITYEPVHTLLSQVDFVISLYSTTLLIAAVAGTPVFVLNSRVQSLIERASGEQKDVYRGLSGFCECVEELSLKLKSFDRGDIPIDTQADVVHLRKIWQDGALDHCLDRIDYLVSGCVSECSDHVC